MMRVCGPRLSTANFITTCTPATWSYLGPGVIDAYLTAGLSGFYFASISEVSKMNTDIALFEKVLAGSTFSNSAASESYMTSLYYALKSEREFLWGSAGDAAVNFQDLMTDGCLFTTCTNQYSSESLSFTSAGDSGLFYYSASTPCCGQCTIYAEGVQLSYWPTPAPTPPVTKLVDSQNHTFISPLVYASFTGVYGWNECGQVGGMYDVTGTYLPDYLRTTSINRNLTTIDSQQWTTIDYADFGPQCTCTTNCQTDPSLGVITNLCTPQLSLPNGFTSLLPAWSTCVMGFLGVFDPPVALTVQPGLTVPKTTSAPPIPPPTTPSPQPVQTPTQPQGTPTAQSEITSPPVETSSTSNVATIIATSSIPVSNAPPPVHSTSKPPVQAPSITPTMIVIGTQTMTPPSARTTILPPLTIGGETITANSQGHYVIGTQTITAGGGPITIVGQTITPNAQGDYIIGSQTITAGNGQLVIPPPITINGETITANAQGDYVVGSQTITPGSGPITVAEPPLVIAGQIITANSQGDYVVGSQTLIPGGTAITVSGSTISLASGASDIVVFGTGVTSTQNLASVILSIIGGVPTSTTSGAPVQYTGAATRGADRVRLELVGVVVGLAGASLLF
ncbi:uncharacterized protein LY89DRAFT_668019 [Mollisia scopiformis]|uniref:Uncharacterized protein n=1 Tax=Mollisia scopiformis TaxID=149040 RepID=A0A194XFK8_MOLSC|nr:uncharacterized protein LY89DRAFT_668019 [Mollisia scopiformis]KUJ18980.1 hypothetical protein LY89DRAFT_668019 [Mollisia scopiformis]